LAPRSPLVVRPVNTSAFTIRVFIFRACHNVHLLKLPEESGSNAVKELGNDGGWYNGALNVSGAVGSTSLAAVAYYFQEQTQLRVYYQAADLTLREYGYNGGSEWFQGLFIGSV
jgi:hypothetical protein